LFQGNTNWCIPHNSKGLLRMHGGLSKTSEWTLCWWPSRSPAKRNFCQDSLLMTFKISCKAKLLPRLSVDDLQDLLQTETSAETLCWWPSRSPAKRNIRRDSLLMTFKISCKAKLPPRLPVDALQDLLRSETSAETLCWWPSRSPAKRNFAETLCWWPLRSPAKRNFCRESLLMPFKISYNTKLPPRLSVDDL
jgi:hypothetical protein